MTSQRTAIVLAGSGSVGTALLRELFRDDAFDTSSRSRAARYPSRRAGSCHRPKTAGEARSRDEAGHSRGGTRDAAREPGEIAAWSTEVRHELSLQKVGDSALLDGLCK